MIIKQSKCIKSIRPTSHKYHKGAEINIVFESQRRLPGRSDS